MLSVRRYAANFLTGLLPPTRCYRLKSAIWRAAGVDVCPTARLVSSVRIWTSGPVSIGPGAFLGHEVLIVGGNAPVRIGASCDLAPRVMLVTGTHLDGGAERAAGLGLSRPILIGNGTWIGASTTVLCGVEIGDGTVIGAGSVVNKSISAQVIAVGVPCAVIKDRHC
jgi:acetyltransferase-like isoleucine patch superfamily enzyme